MNSLHHEIRNLELYVFHDNLCNRLLDALVKRRIDIDDFDFYFSFHDEQRAILSRDALAKCFIHHI